MATASLPWGPATAEWRRPRARRSRHGGARS